jgi:hypothetical protein
VPTGFATASAASDTLINSPDRQRGQRDRTTFSAVGWRQQLDFAFRSAPTLPTRRTVACAVDDLLGRVWRQQQLRQSLFQRHQRHHSERPAAWAAVSNSHGLAVFVPLTRLNDGSTTETGFKIERSPDGMNSCVESAGWRVNVTTIKIKVVRCRHVSLLPRPLVQPPATPHCTPASNQTRGRRLHMERRQRLVSPR